MNNYIMVTDMRVLNAVSRRNPSLKFDSKYRYCIAGSETVPFGLSYRGNAYRFKYFDGCFFPYLVEVVK